MNDELLTMVERDVLSWPGVTKETGRGGGPGQGGFWVPPATVYRFGRRQIGHIHDTGVRTSRSREEFTMSLCPMNVRSRTGLDSQAL